MSNILSQLWEFLSQPLLQEEARFWFSVALFGAFVLLPFWVLAYGKYINRIKRLETNKDNTVKGAN